ncbi:MAG: phosphohistidine phosphatase SixA [Gammaproteobacteria bacterium]|nr:phosphohistidine phosphatase SixA [Gammaproteobacteria bacterium]
MKLYLMRHGLASSPQDDPQQGLSPEGRAGIEALAKRLADQKVQFACIYHSEKDRARQTAEIMAAITSPQITPQLRSGLKPNDDPDDWLAEIDTLQEDTLITSHLPFVPGLVELLNGVPLDVAFVPGILICLQKQGSGWQVMWHMAP